MTLYRTIVADPPWAYDDGFATASRGDTWADKPATRALPYSSMSVDEIAALPVGDLAHPDGAYLFCWTTSRYLPATFPILESWGFVYRQTLVWHKVKSVSPFGGTVAPNHAEFVLVARKGSVKLSGRAKSSVLVAPGMSGRRHAAHSRKPESFLDMVEAVSPGPYVELFARRARFGWDYWGDQSLGTAEVAA